MTPSETTARVVDADHPWLGLSPFTEATQSFFFGRDDEIRDLFLRVREHPLTVLYGQSGLGKTSLLGAGLIPKLKVEGFRPVLLRLGYDDYSPPVLHQVLAFIGTLGERHSVSLRDTPGSPSSTLWEIYHHIPSRPPQLAAAPPVLIFDQFEEIFTLGQSPTRQAEARELFVQLADLIENRPPASVQDQWRADRKLAREYDLAPSRVRVVVTLREDYLSQLEAWKKVLPSLMRNRTGLELLNGPQALEAVVRPGRMADRRLVSEEVGAQIVRFVAKRPASTPLEEIGAVPPLLSLVCEQLNKTRLRTGASEITSDQVAEQSADILQKFYNRSFDGLPIEVRRFIERRMVTVGGHRNAIAREDAVSELEEVGVALPDAAIDELIHRRLLSAEQRAGVQRLEITHDVLAPLVVRSRDERRGKETAEVQAREAKKTAEIQARKANEAEMRAAESERQAREAKREAERDAREARRALRRILGLSAILAVVSVPGCVVAYVWALPSTSSSTRFLESIGFSAASIAASWVYVRMYQRKSESELNRLRKELKKLDKSVKTDPDTVVVSYSPKDRALAARLQAELGRRGILTWHDEDDLPGGTPWRHKTVRAIQDGNCRALLFLASKHANESLHVLTALEIAKDAKKPILPICLDDTPFENRLRYLLAGIQRLKLHERTWEADLDRLLAALDRLSHEHR